MKVTISLPDTLFRAAEQLAEQLCVSRSQLYAQALADFMEKRDDASIIQRLNTVHGTKQERLDPDLNKAQIEVLGDEA
jgi:metal-responsive CopG/Arc/MetJ family transcriptional regulator